MHRRACGQTSRWFRRASWSECRHSLRHGPPPRVPPRHRLSPHSNGLQLLPHLQLPLPYLPSVVRREAPQVPTSYTAPPAQQVDGQAINNTMDGPAQCTAGAAASTTSAWCLDSRLELSHELSSRDGSESHPINRIETGGVSSVQNTCIEKVMLSGLLYCTVYKILT